MKSCRAFSFLPDMKQATADFYLVFYVLAYLPDFLFDIIVSFYLFSMNLLWNFCITVMNSSGSLLITSSLI